MKKNSFFVFILISRDRRNSKVDFSGEPDGDHGFLLNNAIKMKYLDRNKLGASTLFGMLIAH